ncbi:AMP-binding protein [Siminovitchia sp. FSL W7-1587]|uniref:class I adenylate-forming enzyme family protein n=1 Tax=Siminovitchia sp. FSL W7-1587 TaxID=2954699 RepID=UPI0030CB7B9A
MKQMLVGDPIKLNSIRYPEKVALSFKGKRFTYRQFNNRVNQLGNALLDIGIQKGDKVAFMLFNGNELFEIIVACSKIGAMYVPINSRFTAREIKHVLDDSGAILFMYDYRFGDEVSKIHQELLTTKYFVTVGNQDRLSFTIYDEWIERFPASEPEIAEPLSELDELCLMYTGGTTGLPKGAIHTHRSLYLVLTHFSIEFSISRNGKGLAAGPLFGAAAISIAMPNLFVGNPIHIVEQFHPLEVLKAIDQEKTTTAFLAPPMLDAIFALPDEIKNSFDVSSMKSVISVGAPLLTRTKTKALEFFPNAELNEFYGASELGGAANLHHEYMRKKDRCVGLPMLGMELKIVDQDGKEVKQGEVGEILVRGLTLCKGYYHNAQATNEAFRGEWLGLGDMARQDDEGFYYLVERKQDMIISGAFNVYPAEIEAVLHEHPSVREAAVIGVPHDQWGEVPMAVIALHDDQDVSEREIIEYCTGKMAKYKIPHKVEFVKMLPRNLQGKVLTYTLKEKYGKVNQSNIN